MPDIASSPELRSLQSVPEGILDQLGDAVIALDREGHVRFANRAAERLIGKRAEELRNYVVWKELAVICGGRLDGECRRAVEEQQPREFEEYDSTTGRWLDVRLFPSNEGLTIHLCDVTRRKLEEIAQADREKWYATLVNSIGGILWEADAETFQFSFVSRQVEQTLGYPVDRWLKEPDFWRRHVYPDDLDRCASFCIEATAKRLDHEFEYRMFASDGRIVWLRDIVSVKVEDGVTRLRGIMLDITEQKQAEEKLHRKEEHFRRLVEHAWDVISIMTPDTTVLYVSPSCERLLGYKPEELLGRKGFEWTHPDDIERGKEFYNDVFAKEQTVGRFEFRGRHKDGSWRIFESMVKRYVDEDGRAVALNNTRDITIRSRMEARLRESEARFRLLFEKNAAGMAIVSVDYRILQVNPAICRMFGYSEEELRGKTVADLINPDDLDETRRNFEEVIDGRRPAIDMEQRYIHKNGGIVWGHISAVALLSEGRPLYCIATIQNITERKEAAEALRVSEERYRSLILASTQVVWVTNEFGEAIPDQSSWAALTGQSEEEILGWGWLDAVHPEDRSRVKRVWRERVEDKAYYQGEFRIRTARGEYRDFSVRGVPVLKPDGGVREWVGTCTDITERKRAAADILEWKNRYEAAVASSGQLLYDWEPAKDQVTYGGNLREMLGYSPEEISGGLSQWLDLVHPDDRDAFNREVAQVYRTRESFHLEYRLRHKDGSYRVVNDQGHLYLPVNGSIHSMIGFISDITERKNDLLRLASAKEEAEAANRAKDDFLAALSHELRTPLNPVLMLTSELENSADLPDSARRDFSMIRKNVELEARIIDDLLDLTRITRGKIHLKLRSLEVNALVTQAIEVVRADLDAKQHILAVDLSAPVQRIVGDSVRLQQVVWNVLKNAVKFTPPGGEIAIVSHNTTDGKVLLEVSDTGIGIAAEDLPHIFEPFVQGGAGGHQFGGLGLGLTISRRIVELHNGRIWAESAGRGAGTTFYIELPLAPTEIAEPRTGPPTILRHPSISTGARILLVEDHEPTRVTLGRLLTRHGYQISSADSVAAARDLAAHETFDLVASDIGLPDGSGHDLMVELRDRYGLTGIALSGYGMEEDIQRSLASGFAVHLTKPVDMQSLQSAITDLEKHAP